MSKIIKEIHESKLFGVVIEAGCSAAAASALMNIPGSSNTIYRCEQVYSKEYQELHYGKFKRSVSREWVKKVLEIESTKCDKINFILASSWQLNNENPNGWFGLFDIQRNVKYYLHYTFVPKVSTDTTYSRQWLINSIGEISVEILHSAISGNINEISSKSAILDIAYINDFMDFELLIEQLEKSNEDYFLTFENNKAIRFIDLLRKNKLHIIMKGSYSPLHYGHIDIINKSLEKYKDSYASLLIGLYRYDKPHLTIDEIKDKILSINNSGYTVIICKSILYYDTFDILNKFSFDEKFLFPLGMDTISRIIKTDEDTNINIVDKINSYKEKYKFLVFNRQSYVPNENISKYNDIIELIERNDDGISSSKIRNGEMTNK